MPESSETGAAESTTTLVTTAGHTTSGDATGTLGSHSTASTNSAGTTGVGTEQGSTEDTAAIDVEGSSESTEESDASGSTGADGGVSGSAGSDEAGDAADTTETSSSSSTSSATTSDDGSDAESEADERDEFDAEDGDEAGASSEAETETETETGSESATEESSSEGRCTDVEVGCDCTAAPEFQCKSQKISLYCQSGIWELGEVCESSQNCNRTTGLCDTIIDECAGQTVGHAFCDEGDLPGIRDLLRECGPDLVTTQDRECEGICVDGACQAPVCGDGKVERGETCDDGNTVKLDGCEPDGCVPSGVMKISLGSRHTCALLQPGYVKCWGKNEDGQLALGHLDPVYDRHPNAIYDEEGSLVITLPGLAQDVSAGSNHTCVLVEGSVYCFGSNDHGELGYPLAMNAAGKSPKQLGFVPVDVGGEVVAISAYTTSCALMSGRTSLRCWGRNYRGALGLGTAEEPSRTLHPADYGPVTFGPHAPVREVALGASHSCVLFDDGQVQCWGRGSEGKLGLGTESMPRTDNIGDDEPLSAPNATKVPLASGRTPAQLTAGLDFTCIRFEDGIAQCWGSNSNLGNLGLGHSETIGDDESPAEKGVLSLVRDPATHLVSGAAFSCGTFTSGQFRCWGSNASAQLGYPDRNDRGASPSTVPGELSPVNLGAGFDELSDFDLGHAHVCAVLDTRHLRCWGNNDYGELGLGYKSDFVGGSPGTTPADISDIQLFLP